MRPLNPFTYMTGTSWYLVGVFLFGSIATGTAIFLVRRAIRGRRNFREVLTPEQFRLVDADSLMHIVIWVVRSFQVAIVSIFVFVAFGVLTFPLDQRFSTALFLYIAVTIMLEPFLWMLLGLAESWMGRKGRWK